jgi:hypothetical protein
MLPAREPQAVAVYLWLRFVGKSVSELECFDAKTINGDY